MTLHQIPRVGDVLISDAPTLVGKLIMAGTESECGHVGYVRATTEDPDRFETHEGFPAEPKRGLPSGIRKQSRTVGEDHITYVTVCHTPDEVELLNRRSDELVDQNAGYAWGEIARIGVWALASWLTVLGMPTFAGWLTSTVERVARIVENPNRRICSNHVGELLHTLWTYRAERGDGIAQHMLDTAEWPPERQFPGYVTKRIRTAARLYDQAGYVPNGAGVAPSEKATAA